MASFERDQYRLVEDDGEFTFFYKGRKINKKDVPSSYKRHLYTDFREFDLNEFESELEEREKKVEKKEDELNEMKKEVKEREARINNWLQTLQTFEDDMVQRLKKLQKEEKFLMKVRENMFESKQPFEVDNLSEISISEEEIDAGEPVYWSEDEWEGWAYEANVDLDNVLVKRVYRVPEGHNVLIYTSTGEYEVYQNEYPLPNANIDFFRDTVEKMDLIDEIDKLVPVGVDRLFTNKAGQIIYKGYVIPSAVLLSPQDDLPLYEDFLEQQERRAQENELQAMRELLEMEGIQTRKDYREWSRRNDPDRVVDQEQKQLQTERTQRVNEAVSVLDL